MENILELDKKKYTRLEVENLIADVRSSYEEKLSAHKLRIKELLSQLNSVQAELFSYKENDEKLASAIKDAEDFSRKLKDDAKKRYDAEVESLKTFAIRWRSFFEMLKERYPLYGKVQDSKKIYDEIARIVSSASGEKAVLGADKILDDNAVVGEALFDPKGKIDDYISATSDNGFNLNDVLNPGELELEELCRELGLIDESL